MNRRFPMFMLNMAFVALGVLMFLPDTMPVWAQDGGDVVGEEVEVIPAGIPPLSNRTALLSIPISVFPFNEPNKMPVFRLQELAELTVVIEDKTEGRIGLDIEEDFLDLSTSAINSGLSLFKESESQRGFNYSVEDQSKDLPIDLLEKPIVEADPVVPGRYTITFRPLPGSPNVQLPFFKDQFADFYVVARTSLNLMHGDRFETYIPANGIRIKDIRQTLVSDTIYPDRFPGDAFADLTPEFTVPSIFEGDIVQIANLITEVENNNRIDASSEATTVLGIDMVGRQDQGYFIEEIRINWLGINLGAVARLIANLSQSFYLTGSAGYQAAMPSGLMEQVFFMTQPTYFYSPWFYNTPINMETGEILATVAPGDGETIMPMTMPLDMYGFPMRTFIIGGDDYNNHVTSYVPYGPREPGAYGLTPRVVSQDIFKALRTDSAGGMFLYRELGGVRGKYDEGVDHLIGLDSDGYSIENFEISPESASDPNSPFYQLMRRMLPAAVGGDSGKTVIPMLFGDDNLAALLMGIGEIPEAAEEPRPPYGSLECTEDPDCYFFDLLVNVLRPYLGLTEGQIRYLFEYTEGNGRTNSEDLFNYNLLQGFTYVLPVGKNNAMSDLLTPGTRTGNNVGPEIYLAVRTSDNLRSLDSFIPFIQPNDIKVGTNVEGFTNNELDNVESLRSVSSIGYGRPNTGMTYTLIGRPRPRFSYQDLTQPGEGEFAGNNNILLDSSQSSPPKAVIGIDAQDFGQNPLLVNNHESIEFNVFDTFFTESTVFGEVQIDFLPGTQSVIFNPLLFNAIPAQLGIGVEFSRVVSNHSIALYYDDDTSSGNNRDDDGDGLVDEEWHNLQDDDGDGLIDEDLGDMTPAGINGVFDAMDHYFPTDRDRFGGTGANAYVFPPNSQEKYQEYIDAIQPADNPLTLVDGGVLPLNLSEGSYFAELDMRVLNIGQYQAFRSDIFPRGFSGSTYNQGMTRWLEPRTGLLDLIAAFRSGGGDFEAFPYYPDDLFIETADTGDIIWLIAFTPDSEDSIRMVRDPDGDVRRTFALSMNGGLRIPHPMRGFVRVGWTPMVVQVSEVEGAEAEDPQGESLATAPYHQFGFDISLTDYNAIGDYVSGIRDTLNSAYEQARTTIEEYATAVEDAEAAAADVGEDEQPGEPEYPDPPEPQEIDITSPYATLGLNQFLETAEYDTNYQFQLQIPDENFGPLQGNDFYVVLRSSPVARVGETFRVRIRGGQRNAAVVITDPDTGDQTVVSKPEGGIAYTSFLETDYGMTYAAYRNVSKNQITTGEIIVQSINVAPSITFMSPNSGINLADENFEFDITFVAADPDDVADIRLFVDTDSLDFNGQFLPGARLREGFDQVFSLNMLEDIEDFDPTQQYYIYAEINDGVNQPIYVYADGPIATSAVSPGEGNDGGGTIVTGNLKNPLDYVKLKNDGVIFSLGDTPKFNRIESTTRVIDMEVTPTFSGQIAVQVDGQVIGSGDLGSIFARVMQPDGSFKFPENEVFFYKNSLSGGVLISNPTEDQITIESARDVEVDFVNGAIYVLDGDGDMLFLGKANTDLRPEPMGIDMYRDMELAPNGKVLYFLTGNGIFSSAGNSAISGWSDIVVGDVYRDMSLRTSGGAVTHVVITDSDGNITVLGGGAVKTTLESLTSDIPIPAGTIRQVKLFPNTDNTIILIEGSGKVHILTNDENVVAPTDQLIFSDQPGLDDDIIVDTETTSINLQSVVDSVRDIIDGFSVENSSQIMAHVSPDYSDKTGADVVGLQKSLNSFFGLYEVQNYSISNANPNNFTVVNQGDTIVAQVIIDLSLWYPTVFYRVPEVEQDAIGGTYEGRFLFSSDTRITFDQTISIREVGDGRGWFVELYEIRNYGRQQDELLDSDTAEYEDIIYLLGLTRNNRLATYVPRRIGMDDPMMVNLNINEKNSLEPYNVLAIFREPYYATDSAPPVFEFTTFQGSFLSSIGFDIVDFEFKPNADGVMKLVSMDMRQVITTNDSQFISVDPTDQQNPLTDLSDNEVAGPTGFSFKQRGPVKAIFQGDADVIVPDSQTLQGSFPLGGIMMLPEGTNIFTINPSVMVKDELNRSIVKQNPYDPNQDTGNVDGVGFVASLLPGRAYFVIAADGIHYGFIQIPEIPGGLEDTEDVIIPFDFRYKDSFILPKGF